jgi:magnesium chelatase family protein
MLACVRTFALDGLQARPVSVEVDLRPGLPAFTVVGLGDAAVRESRERVHAAILNSGFEFPARRLTANLAPAHLPKVGPGFDLALACGVLAASGQVSAALLERYAVFGELSLGGAVRPCRGTLAVAQAARTAGLRGIVVADRRGAEAALVPGLTVAGVGDLRSAAEVLAGRRVPTGPRALGHRAAVGGAGVDERDLVDVGGQTAGVQALVLAAAGGHNLLFSGPPGVGKTMLAWRLPGILPPLVHSEAIEVTRVHSIAQPSLPRGLAYERPFRAPHHTVTAAGLVGGANPNIVGEAVLAHHGVLFLDELSEFSRPALEALRQPLEDGRVAIVRAAHTVIHPARFMLVAATNPCPCGRGVDDRHCVCSEAALARHQRKLSSAILDRIDIVVDLKRPTHAELRAPGRLSSARARELVSEARRRQAARTGQAGAVNARLSGPLLAACAGLDRRGDALIAAAYERGLLSARGHQRTLKIARTIADLAGSPRVRAEHVSRALALRREFAVASAPTAVDQHAGAP